MKPENKIKVIAEIDGKQINEHACHCWKCAQAFGLHYLTSYDAILPVIVKWCEANGWFDFFDCLFEDQEWINNAHTTNLIHVFKSTPKQLSDALIKASGKWEE